MTHLAQPVNDALVSQRPWQIVNHKEAFSCHWQATMEFKPPLPLLQTSYCSFCEDKDQIKQFLLNLYFLYRGNIFLKLYDCTTIKLILTAEEVSCLECRTWPGNFLVLYSVLLTQFLTLEQPHKMSRELRRPVTEMLVCVQLLVRGIHLLDGQHLKLVKNGFKISQRWLNVPKITLETAVCQKKASYWTHCSVRMRTSDEGVSFQS